VVSFGVVKKKTKIKPLFCKKRSLKRSELMFNKVYQTLAGGQLSWKYCQCLPKDFTS